MMLSVHYGLYVLLSTEGHRCDEGIEKAVGFQKTYMEAVVYIPKFLRSPICHQMSLIILRQSDEILKKKRCIEFMEGIREIVSLNVSKTSANVRHLFLEQMIFSLEKGEISLPQDL